MSDASHLAFLLGFHATWSPSKNAKCQVARTIDILVHTVCIPQEMESEEQKTRSFYSRLVGVKTSGRFPTPFWKCCDYSTLFGVWIQRTVELFLIYSTNCWIIFDLFNQRLNLFSFIQQTVEFDTNSMEELNPIRSQFFESTSSLLLPLCYFSVRRHF
jgi:hypothetical protein